MMSRGLDVSLRLTAVIGGVGLAFAAWDGPARDLETTTLMTLIAPFAGSAHFVRLPGPHVLITTRDAFPFIGTITPSCSALGAVLAFASVAALVLRGPALRRAYGFALAAGLCVAANLVRIGAALVIGAHYGREAMVTFHDWGGTGFGLLALFGGFVLLLRAMLPSLNSLLDAGPTTPGTM